MAIARPTKLEIIVIANQHKEIEYKPQVLDFVGIVKFLYAQGIFIPKKMKTAMHVLLFLDT